MNLFVGPPGLARLRESGRVRKFIRAPPPVESAKLKQPDAALTQDVGCDMF